VNPKVLIVDDSQLARRTLRRILDSLGCSVEEAQDGMTALERYFLERPDVVFLDLLMTGMHGLDVLQKLRELDPAARVIVVSADIQDSTRRMVEQAGASGFINKPYDAERVVEAMSAVLEGGRSWS
jgi:two-component system chemotaxis response regulator CheY